MKALPVRLEVPRVVRLVYDAQSGRVVHTHYVVVLPNAQAPSDEQADADAISLAGKVARHPTDSLKVLTVKADDFRDDASYLVNTATGKLEQVVKPSREPPGSQRR